MSVLPVLVAGSCIYEFIVFLIFFVVTYICHIFYIVDEAVYLVAIIIMSN